MAISSTKQCVKCLEEKICDPDNIEESDFPRYKNTKSGGYIGRHTCKECVNKFKKQRRKMNKLNAVQWQPIESIIDILQGEISRCKDPSQIPDYMDRLQKFFHERMIVNSVSRSQYVMINNKSVTDIRER